ncbi:MAG: hypothetical protein AAGD05_17470, partial [Bacteroidota bacterium]
GDVKYSIPVRLPLQEEEIAAAKANYEANLQSYQAALKELEEVEALVDQQYRFIRTMQLNNFGVYNYDILWKQPEMIALKADFDFEHLSTALKEKVIVYLVTGDDRVVIGFPMADWPKFRFSPEADNKLFAVLPNDQVALFSRSRFSKALGQMEAAAGGTYVFEMQTEEKAVDDIADIATLLTLADE